MTGTPSPDAIAGMAHIAAAARSHLLIEAALQPYRNAVYLYLRVAGVVWIAVEWVAAVALWRGQALMGRLARELAPHD